MLSSAFLVSMVRACFFLFLAFRLGAVFFDMRTHSLDGDAEEIIRFGLHSILNLLVCRVQFSPVGFVVIFHIWLPLMPKYILKHGFFSSAVGYESWLFQFGCSSQFVWCKCALLFFLYGFQAVGCLLRSAHTLLGWNRLGSCLI